MERELKEKETSMREEMEKKMLEVEEEKRRLEAEYREALRSEVESTEAAFRVAPPGSVNCAARLPRGKLCQRGRPANRAAWGRHIESGDELSCPRV